MGDKDLLQDRVNRYMIKEVRAEQVEVIQKHGAEINVSDTTATEFKDTLKVILPVGMSKLQGSYNLLKQFEEEETLRSYNRTYNHYFINDFLIAMGILIPRYFGMLHVSKVDTNGRPAGNDYIQFPIRFENQKLTTEKGYVGSIKAPVWEDAIIDIQASGTIIVKAKLKYESSVTKFLNDVEQAIKANSIIRGTAVKVYEVHGGVMAEPIDARINKKIVLSSDVERIIANLVIPSLGDRSKTSLLFTGDFGTGKTETAIRVGLEGQAQFNRTFFYLQNAEMFEVLIPYIKNYQAATVFVEDVDQISSGDRDSSMNDLLNQLDGHELKHVDCTFIFTTNNHDNIHPAMRRPGRIDQVVHFDYCDLAAVAKIFSIYAEGKEGEAEVDFMSAAQQAPEKLQGAVVAEIARRAVKYADKLYGGVISTDRYLDAISSMKHHIEFMKAEQNKVDTAQNLWERLLYKGLKGAFPSIDIDNPYVPNFMNGKYAEEAHLD